VNFLKLCDEQNPDMRVVLRGAGLPKLRRWGMKKFFGERQYRAFWQETLETHKIRLQPKIDFFYYHDRAANVTERGLNFRKGPRQDLSSINCPRVDAWLHFLYNGDLILCCMDYHRETAFGNIKTRSLKEILSGHDFKHLRAQARGEAASPDNFICRRCYSPGG
ncbi:MAG: SPASM domain-containing protein, partial [Deltaproteobacteria bacterium]|nr:SPASM domain-containing protein [Deltaproteobacteria bacterium]